MRQFKVIAIVIATIVTAGPLTAQAQVVAVLSSNAPLRAKITRVLKQGGVRVMAGNQVAKEMANERPPLSEADWARIAGNLGVDAFVGASISRDGAGPQIEIVIRSGADGSIAGQQTLSARVRPKEMGTLLKALSRRRGAAVAQEAQPPTELQGGDLPAAGVPAVEPTRAAPAKSEASAPSPLMNHAFEPQAAATRADESAAISDGTSGEGTAVVVTRRGEGSRRFDGAVGKLSTFDVEVDARTLRRTFDYEGGGGGRRYLLGFNPVVGARASYFPIRNAGLFGAGEFGAGLETGPYPTGTRELMGGALVRIPWSVGQVGASAAYFHHAFLVQDTPSPADASRLTLAIPNTVYGGVRLSVNARIAIARRVQVAVDGAYRLVTSVGDRVGEVRSAAYFPGASAPYGLDGRAFIGVGLGSMFEARAGIDYRRYVYGGLQGTTSNGTAISASGAVDQYVAISLGLAAVLGPR